MTTVLPRDAPAPTRRRRPRFTFWTGVTAATILVFVVLLLLPLFSLVISSFAGKQSDDVSLWQVYVTLFTKPYYYKALINSFVLSIAAMALSLIIGFPLAYCVTRFNIAGKLIIRAVIVLTFVSPPFIGAYSWILLLGESGVLRRWLAAVGVTLPPIYGWFGLILVLSLQGIPFVFLMVSSALKTVDQSIEDAAINLGRGPIAVIRTAILPLIVPGVSTAALLVFVTAFSDFGTPAIIGQNLRVFPRLVYNEFVNETTGGNFTVASALSVVLLAVSICALLAQRGYAERRSYGQEVLRPLAVQRIGGVRRLLATAFVYAVVFVAALPIVTVVVSSFLESKHSVITGNFTIEGYLQAPRLWSSLLNTLMFATVATLLCVVFGALVGYVTARFRTRLASFIDLMSMMPYAVPGVVLGIAFALCFAGAPLFLGGTAAILILAYFVRRLPYSIRSTSAMLSQMGTQTEEASINLGVAPGKTFLRITVPMMTPALMSGALLTWATVAREFNATVILYGSRTTTMSVEVFREVLYGNFGNASVVGTVLIAVSIVPIVILFKALGKDEDVLL